MKTENYNKNIVKKPWGFEYLVYQSPQVALWCLFISENQQTSMHCHANKTTGLIVADGLCEVSFFSNSIVIPALEKIMIRKGLFHSTKSISENGSIVFEIETPNDKQDLVRLDDIYGRAGKPYESSDFEYPKKNDCLWIDENFNLSHDTYANCSLQLLQVSSSEFFYNFADKTNFIILSGGITTDYNVTIINPGDIINNVIAKKIIAEYNNVLPKTYVLVMDKEIIT